MANETGGEAEACPVSPETRAAWLKSRPSNTNPGPPASAASATQTTTLSNIDSSRAPPPSRSIFSRLFGSSTPPQEAATPSNPLGLDRVISTIPRASRAPDSLTPSTKPANSEKESGNHESGNWIYPSEKMFFEAMKRKGFEGQAEEVKTIVPLHNAINERAWKEIKEWEAPWGAVEKCGGPKLDSFLGDSSKMSPRARFNTLMGYTAPFDRHDWVVDRCGTRVEYVIDFYQGRSDGAGKGKLNMYLDVRPKLNTVEGCKMRAAKFIGLV